MAVSEIRAIVDSVKIVLKGFKIGSVVGLLQDLVFDMKLLVSMVSNILKLVSLILSPIMFVITGLLMPLILILKPIAIAVNKLMLPFLQVALEFMREGGEAINAGDAIGGAQLLMEGSLILIAGLQVVIISFTGQVLATLLTLAAEMILFAIAPLLGISDEKVNDIAAMIGDLANLPFALLAGSLIKGVADMIELFGKDSSKFEKDAKAAIDSTFMSGEGKNLKDLLVNETQSHTKSIGDSIKEIFGANGLSGLFGLGMFNVGEVGATLVTRIIQAARDRAAQIIAEAEGGEE